MLKDSISIGSIRAQIILPDAKSPLNPRGFGVCIAADDVTSDFLRQSAGLVGALVSERRQILQTFSALDIKTDERHQDVLGDILDSDEYTSMIPSLTDAYFHQDGSLDNRKAFMYDIGLAWNHPGKERQSGTGTQVIPLQQYLHARYQFLFSTKGQRHWIMQTADSKRNSCIYC